ncbi:21104_t:CDS:2 [Dentiscutata erythropus]|uniref:21104_t:CDS:1 n=1 Tax=Dentiscutata erythropus TaxID=1348616 RepID=A0A9N9IQ62_9GLOM|nr:21104_t:CDS:2 [Dentiscutata erythropus]
MNDNYKPQDNLIDKIDPYFLSEDNSFSDWNKWSLVSFLDAILKSDAPVTMKEVIKDLKMSVDLLWMKVKTDEEIAVAEAEYQRKQAFLELKNRVIESHEKEVKDVNVIIIADMVV